MYFTIWKDAAGEWRWRLQGANNEIIASGESYKNKADCEAAIDLVRSTSDATPVREG
ncbi:DUF1508 domain-containing protein [Rhodomicrobium vannielii ATCC 17100]|uniref:YegP family protein n=1 Tax=Rhodomicrobium vannielii TaxID=1069 RepID=UPI00191AA527|nr:DUF1508 domain-containing protein [Rhodomicrobium vannielii]MBJ7535829.1 DUF1508 domain-containing protein [Rhodomicrobium vannielii ATCC 17100]